MTMHRARTAKTPRLLMIALVLTAAMLAVGASRAGAQSLSASNPTASTTTPTTPWVAPERASRQVNPVPSSPDAISRGHAVYAKECEKCHGKAGHGDGPQAAYLATKPADLAELVQAQTDGSLFYKITEGRGQMPKAKVNDNEKWAVIDYLRTFSAKK
jgi:mono/diheme cytochrome c family protein